MKKYLDKIEIELDGNALNEMTMLGSGPDLFISAGCSWARAWGADDAWGHQTQSRHEYKDNLDFLQNHSYSGLVSKHLNLSAMMMLAVPGSNNDMQSRLIIEFLQKNKNKFRKIFVMWGITSHLRWELYSNSLNTPSMFTVGNKLGPGKEEERNWYLYHHWNEKFELERLSRTIITTHAYLKMLDIDHLFFPVFESFNQQLMDLDNVAPQNFFELDTNPNDIMSLWCQQEKIKRPKNVLSNAFNSKDKEKLTQLIDRGYLAETTAHPNTKGHADIADKLIAHITKYQ
jgi:hypothetical protein